MTRERRPVSARALILGAILLVAALGLSIVGAATILAQRERVISDVTARLLAQVDALDQVAGLRIVVEGEGEVTEPDRFTTVEDFLVAAVSRLLPGRNSTSLALIDEEVLVRSDNELSAALVADPAFVQAAARAADANSVSPIPDTAQTDGREIRYIALPVMVPGDDAAGVYVRAIDQSAELEPVDTALRTYLLAALATLAAIAVVGWFVAGRVLSPIRHLRETADSITITDLGARIRPTEGNDDISDLTRTVNSMLDRLEGSVDVQRQLLDDVRHELKTPITIVRGHLEMMDVTDPGDVSSTRELGILELDRMTRLVEDIDLLSSAEGDQFAFAPIDLSTLTARMGDLVAAIPEHTWRVVRSARGPIEADGDRLLQAWLQLADNAAKYTPSGTPIEIGSEFGLDGARLWVQDHGPGIPAALRRRVFRRFARADGQRSVGGSGLGLAIVDAIAKAHGGTCLITDSPGGGATFTIVVPVSQNDPHDLPAPVRAGDVVLQREATG